MKELREYLKLVKRYLWVFGLLATLGVVGVLIYQQSQKSLYQAVTSLYVNRTPEPRTDKYYTYEGYYAQLVSKDYTDVAVALLGSADFTHLAQTKAHLDNEAKITTQVRKIGPQLIGLTVTGSSQEVVKKATQSLIDTVNDRSKSSQNQGADITMVSPDLNVGLKSFNLPLYLGISVFGSLLVTIAFAAIREYFLV